MCNLALVENLYCNDSTDYITKMYMNTIWIIFMEEREKWRQNKWADLDTQERKHFYITIRLKLWLMSNQWNGSSGQDASAWATSQRHLVVTAMGCQKYNWNEYAVRARICWTKGDGRTLFCGVRDKPIWFLYLAMIGLYIEDLLNIQNKWHYMKK